MTFLDDDIASTASLASDITTLDDVEFQGQGTPAAVSQDHDQLPSVEEYKAQQTSTKVLGTMEIEQADNHHDQLPNIEDYKASHGGMEPKSSGKKTLRCLGIALVVLAATVAIIVVPVVLVANDRKGGSLFADGLFGNDNDGGSKDTTRISAVAIYLEALDISTMEDMRRMNSPQNLALKWIADDDEYRLALPEKPATKDADSFGGARRQLQESRRNPFVERYSLAVYYFSLGGPQWDYQLRFLAPTDHCQWFSNFITTSGTIVRLGVNDCKEIDGVNYVWKLGMPNNNLQGTIPDEIQYFHRLETLVTQFNAKLTGTLPDGLSNLEYLQDLQLQYCGLAGTVPVWIGDIKTLVDLGLGNNFMTGTIPGEIGLLDKLEILGLDDNSFEGNLNIFSNMKSLKSMYLEDNAFMGSLPENMYENWPQLEELDLSSNAFITELPDSIFTSKSLIVLDLHENFFKGTLPAIEENNTVLEFMALYDNLFTGPIPSTINAILNLKHLDLAKNELILPFPSELGDLTKLKYLFIGQNNFTDHAFPSFLEKLTLLRELSMKDSQLTGAIPTWIGTLSDLQLLDLGRNKLTGEIPAELGLVSGLDHLLLDRNQLEGLLPDNFALLSDLDLLLIDNNNFSGDTNVLCNSTSYRIVYFTADCKVDPETNITEIECECCDLCCNDANATCNNLDWSVNLDPIWEYGYNRAVYSFSQELLPSE